MRPALPALLRHALAASLFAALITPVAAEPGAVTVSGAVQRPLELSRKQVAAMPAAAQLTHTSTRETDGRSRSTTLRGVRLRALLEAAGLAERDRFDWRKSVVVVTARDGYRAVFSWPELFNTEGGGQVMVVYERDGAPLDANDGPLALAAPADTRWGPRHVRALDRIEVRILRD